MIGDQIPIIQTYDLINLMQTAAHISRKLLDRKFVGVRRNLDGFDIFLHMTGQSAAITGENESHALCLRRVGFFGKAAHHDDVRIAQPFGDTLCHVQAMSGAGVAINDVLAHSKSSKEINWYYLCRYYTIFCTETQGFYDSCVLRHLAFSIFL